MNNFERRKCELLLSNLSAKDPVDALSSVAGEEDVAQPHGVIVRHQLMIRTVDESL